MVDEVEGRDLSFFSVSRSLDDLPALLSLPEEDSTLALSTVISDPLHSVLLKFLMQALASSLEAMVTKP